MGNTLAKFTKDRLKIPVNDARIMKMKLKPKDFLLKNGLCGTPPAQNVQKKYGKNYVAIIAQVD